MLIRLIATAICVSIAFSISAEEKKYDLSDKEPEVGSILDNLNVQKSKSGTIEIYANGELLGKGAAELSIASTERKEIVSVKDGEVTQYNKTLIHYEKQSTVTIFDEVTKETESSTLLNKKVTWMLIDGKYVPELPDATEEQLELLESEPANTPSPYPSEPIAIGHQWEMDREFILAYLNEEMREGFEGKGSLKLIDIVEYQGQTCAKLEFKLAISLPVRQKELEAEGLKSGKLSMELEGITHRSLKDRVDLGGELNGKLNLELVTPTEELGDMTIKIAYEMKFTGGNKLVK